MKRRRRRKGGGGRGEGDKTQAMASDSLLFIFPQITFGEDREGSIERYVGSSPDYMTEDGLCTLYEGLADVRNAECSLVW
jgi:hypothetical protein